MKLKLFYATNRRHRGSNRWRPDEYGTDFSSDGMENLRFGQVNVEVDPTTVNRHLKRTKGDQHDAGDGEKLAGYLTRCCKQNASIRAYQEKINRSYADVHQPNAKFGSASMFRDLRKAMLNHSDVLVYIHGFNVSWQEAVGAALALQLMLNRENTDESKEVLVVLFSWPSNGQALPYVSYKSDRSEAKGSGYAFGRGLLKLRDYLSELKTSSAKTGSPLCNKELHLLCHSMGNYVMQNTLARMREFANGKKLPRLFSHIFLAAPDVDDDVLEHNKAMSDLHELSRNVTVYHNKGDVAMYISDYTKGHPDRLGHEGAARPAQLHRKAHQVNCSHLVTGLTEHSYYLWGPVNCDIRYSIDGISHEDDATRRRRRHANFNNVWELV